MSTFTIKDILRQSMVAAIYVVLVLIFAFLSYDDIQFRIAEVMLILVFFDKKSVLGLLTGTFIANLAGPFGLIDAVVGTSATALALILMMLFRKRKSLAILMPGLANGLIIGLMLHLLIDLPLLATMGWVWLGETMVMVLLAYPLYRVLKGNPHFKALFE